MTDQIQNQFAILPSDPVSRKKIFDALKEISDAKTRAEGEMSYIKESVSTIAEEFSIKKPMINKLWRLYHKGTAKDEKSKIDEVFCAFEILTGQNLD